MIKHPYLHDFITQNTLTANHSHYTCSKQSVHAMIVPLKGDIIYGMNKTLNYVTICPRVEQNMKTGEGYHLCKDICDQGSHAEIDAITNAIENNIELLGSSLYLTGHTYCCDNCLNKMKIAKIKNVYVISEDNKILKEYNLN